MTAEQFKLLIETIAAGFRAVVKAIAHAHNTTDIWGVSASEIIADEGLDDPMNRS